MAEAEIVLRAATNSSQTEDMVNIPIVSKSRSDNDLEVYLR